jgi:hypothetical protein
MLQIIERRDTIKCYKIYHNTSKIAIFVIKKCFRMIQNNILGIIMFEAS